MAWTIKSINDENFWNKKYVEKYEKRLREYYDDPHEESRLKTQECKVCFYLKSGTIAGQAFTKYTCRNCNSVEKHHNTNTPKFCKKCANEFNICIRCGCSL